MKIYKRYDFKNIKGFKLGWSIIGPPLMTVYCYALGDLMVDTGQSHMRKQALQLAEDNRIKRVFLTHHHEDHSGNAAAIKKGTGAQVFGHPLTKKKMKTGFSILPYQKYVWGKTNPLKIEPLPEIIETRFGHMKWVHTPGHSRDHIAYLLRKEGVLFSGDLYLADRIKFFRSDEDIGVQIESLKKVLKLDFDTLLCSHFPQLEQGKKRIKLKLGFLEDLYGSIIVMWEKGYSEKQIFKVLNLKEDKFTKYFCFGNVSMINGVRSAVRHHETGKG